MKENYQLVIALELAAFMEGCRFIKAGSIR